MTLPAVAIELPFLQRRPFQIRAYHETRGNRMDEATGTPESTGRRPFRIRCAVYEVRRSSSRGSCTACSGTDRRRRRKDIIPFRPSLQTRIISGCAFPFTSIFDLTQDANTCCHMVSGLTPGLTRKLKATVNHSATHMKKSAATCCNCGRFFVVGFIGFVNRQTSCLSSRRSKQLSYAPGTKKNHLPYCKEVADFRIVGG